mgnify:CR=1 FL=1
MKIFTSEFEDKLVSIIGTLIVVAGVVLIIDSVYLGNAVEAIIAARKGSYFEADRYERGMSRKFTHEEWEVAHEIADDYEKRGQ